MVAAQVLEATRTVDDKVGRVEDKVLDVDNNMARVDGRVSGVDDNVKAINNKVGRVRDMVLDVDNKVTRVDDRVADVDDNVKAIDNKVAVVIDSTQPFSISQQESIFNFDMGSHGWSKTFVVFFLRWHWCADSSILTGNQLRQDLRRWLSPSDPSTNHNIACGAHRKQTADWFFQGSIFTEWKSNGPLLWLHGKRTFS